MASAFLWFGYCRTDIAERMVVFPEQRESLRRKTDDVKATRSYDPAKMIHLIYHDED
jgi:hypothetical protein